MFFALISVRVSYFTWLTFWTAFRHANWCVATGSEVNAYAANTQFLYVIWRHIFSDKKAAICQLPAPFHIFIEAA